MDDKAIKKEFNKLKSSLPNLDESKMNTILPLLEQAAFIKCLLNEMQNDLKENGYFEYSNYGNSRERPLFRSYKDTLPTYSNLIKAINSIVCERNDEPTESENERTLIIDDIV